MANVLILGGGFGGVIAAESLARQLQVVGQDQYKIVVSYVLRFLPRYLGLTTKLSQRA